VKAPPLENARFIWIGVALLVAGLLIFTRLGHYALWDDEAITALAGKGILSTGDTSVLMDHGNIVAYRHGVLIRGFCDRFDPPLENYLAAASFLVAGVSAWTARLPFALLGIATFALVLYWTRRESWPTLVLVTLGLLCNVSLLLYFRQCRYYGQVIFLSVAMAYVYWNWKATPRALLALAGLSVLLFASNYVSYLALYTGLALDYLLWKRKDWPPTWRNGLLLFGPQVLFIAAIAAVWNPFRTELGTHEAVNTLSDRLLLFYFYWRDADRSEFFSFLILLLALGVGLTYRRFWMVRGLIAMTIYIAAVSLVSPQPMATSDEAEVRYLPALIPLAVALEAGALCLLLQNQKILLGLAAAIVFGTNILNGGWLVSIGWHTRLVNDLNGTPFIDNGIRSTIVSYVRELIDPQKEPYTPAIQWINDHVPEGGSVWVTPDYSTYPLMFHAPRALYAWQLDWPPRPDFAGLPLIHFKGRQPPDYLVDFGPNLGEVEQTVQGMNRPDISYQLAATINVLGRDFYRPELIWRSFKTNTDFDPRTQAVYIFQRTNPPIPTH
jgi:hypothetical protein